MIPTWQTCPKCRNRFKGSDMIGFPCPSCMGINENAMTEALNAMNKFYEEETNDTTK